MVDNEFVDILIQRLEIELIKNDRSGVYGLTQRKFAYNSNKIEGSTLTEKQTISLFETGTLTADGTIIRAKDIEETTGHFIMFNEMLKNFREPLSHEIIKKFHYKLKSGVFEDLANGYPVGEYKTRRNIVADIITATPEEVTKKMTELIESYNNIESPTLIDICKFHAAFEKIHPFQDGNGRTGRVIIFKECLKNNIMPLIINDRNKVQYYLALNKAQTEDDFNLLLDFFQLEQNEYKQEIKDFIIPYNG